MYFEQVWLTGFFLYFFHAQDQEGNEALRTESNQILELSAFLKGLCGISGGIRQSNWTVIPFRLLAAAACLPGLFLPHPLAFD